MTESQIGRRQLLKYNNLKGKSVDCYKILRNIYLTEMISHMKNNCRKSQTFFVVVWGKSKVRFRHKKATTARQYTDHTQFVEPQSKENREKEQKIYERAHKANGGVSKWINKNL